jgi:2'-5' RNA ligase
MQFGECISAKSRQKFKILKVSNTKDKHMAMVRTFVAVTLNESLHTALDKIIGQLSSANAKVKWVETGNIHLTLKFLGNVEEERLPEVFAACERAAEDAHAIDLEMKAVGCFPDMKNPRIVWLGIERGAEALKRIQEKVEAELQAVGFPEEDKQFKAHLTIGRVKGKQGLSRLARLIQEQENVFVGAMRVEKISVMKSTLLPAGPVYTELKAIPLH